MGLNLNITSKRHEYTKAGYIPASECGIKAPFEVDDESFMALNLNGSQNKLNGVIEYDKAFGI